MDAINDKVDDSLIIALIVVMWSDPQMTSFMGLAWMITTNEFAIEYFVLWLEEMHGSQTTENVKKTIEDIVNKYTFDFSKIKGTVNIVREYMNIWKSLVIACLSTFHF